MSLDHLPVSPLSKPEDFNFATHIVDHWARSNPSQNALYWVSQDLNTERKLTYADISSSSHRIAKLLHGLGLRAGDVLIVILPRVPVWWVLATACLRSGIVLCPCTTLLVEKDIEYRLGVSGAVAFVGDEVSVGKCLKVKQRGGLKTIIRVNAGTGSVSGAAEGADGEVKDFDALLAKVPKDTKFEVPSSLKATSPALCFFTSGTTGPPKIVLHTQISYPLAHSLTGAYWLRLTPTKDSVYWNLSEQGWAKAAWSFFGTFTNGATLFVHDDRQAFSAKKTLEVLHRFPISTLCAPPTVYRQLVLDESRQLFEGSLKPQTLRHACGAGEPLNQSVIETWRAMSGGMDICDGYGQTETILICANQKGMKVKPGSMGKPLPGVPLTIINDEGKETQAKEEGDIAVEIDPPGKQEDGFFGIFEGYVLDMKAMKLDRRIRQTKAGKSYYVTGDRATKDEEGYFWFVGRNDDVINSSGYRIGPFEVESTLKLHEAVVESAVVAAPDPDREEVVKAFVVLTQSRWTAVKNDAEKQKSLIKELQDFCKEHAAPYKYPRKVEFVDATFLPKTISGKIKRAELKKLEKDRYQGKSKSKL
ncbi:hypothetical protein LTS08_004124 [Lithohypha guttulata]|nr:hypothetical protein LTS08_004124 [Lithohypha guttulata]